MASPLGHARAGERCAMVITAHTQRGDLHAAEVFDSASGIQLRFDAIVVAGGRSSRLGGVDKTMLLWNGVTLRDWAVRSVGGAAQVSVVGDVRPGESLAPNSSGVANLRVTREHPPFAGPAAALRAGLGAMLEPHAAWTVVIAADLPRVEAAVAEILRELRAANALPDAAAQGFDGVIGVDSSARRQPLLAVYRTQPLLAAVCAHEQAGTLPGLSMRRLLAGLTLRELQLADSLCADVDTPEDAARAGILLEAAPRAAEADTRVAQVIAL